MDREEIIEYLKRQKPELKNKFGVQKIGLFGSYAKGEQNEESDIDIVVELDKPDLLTLVGIKQMIEEHFNSRVDIVRYRQKMNQALKKGLTGTLFMYDFDKELAVSILDNILWALDQIQKRFKIITSADAFLDSDEGLEKLDGICM